MRFVPLLILLVNFSFAQQNKTTVAEGLTPLKVYQKGQITIRSYDFKGLEPILNKSDGTTYVINFWATWCLPCVKELPYFEQLHEKYKDQNVTVVLVSMDMPKKVETILIPFVQKKQLQAEVIHLDDPDANAWIEKVDTTWSGAIPATLMYNAKTRKFYERSFTFEELEKEILTIINN